MTKPRLILIAGPTASGKSALATDLAATISGIIMNADAMQVYQGLPVLTAQPDHAAKQRAQHQLYEMIDPAMAFSAGKWLSLAMTAIQAAWQADHTPIMVGGTGMYFQSLLKGLANIPDIPHDIRAELHDDYTRDGEASIRQRLAQHDPAAAHNITAGDRQRLLRALEIVLATGKTQATWQNEMTGGMLGMADIYPIVTMPPRDALYAACDRRFESMMRNGGVEEAQVLLSRQLSPALPAMKIIGVQEIGAYSLDEATAKAQQATRNYAKRQVTWFRNQWIGNKIGFARPVMVLEKFYTAGDLGMVLEYCGKHKKH